MALSTPASFCGRILATSLFVGLALGVITSPLLGNAGAAAPAAGGGGQNSGALDLLMAGNRRFVKGRMLHPDQTIGRRQDLAKGQQPFAIILTCSDSRVAPEVYFDQGLGDIFVIRTAGNVIGDHVIGSIEYAVEHLKASLLIVVGHERCGAVAAAVAGGHADGHIGSIVEAITPAVKATAGRPGDQVDNTVGTHARMTADALRTSDPILAAAVKAGHLTVLAARYDLDTGRVELLKANDEVEVEAATEGETKAAPAAGAPADPHAAAPAGARAAPAPAEHAPAAGH
ncbi:MAG: carbonic anhydrase [Verrucomicrobia bacterium]|nr:carbonic anhydrase [Verrucomicrobiota bacterium]